MDTLADLAARIRHDFGIPEGLEVHGTKPIFTDMPGDPNCPICHGIGFVTRDCQPGDPDFGKMVPCSCRASEIAAAHDAARTNTANLTGYENMTFETFKPEGQGGLAPSELNCLKFAISKTKQFAANPEKWLLLIGAYGTGKTHLAAAIANYALAHGISNIFQPVPDLLDQLRATYGDTEESYEERFDRIRNIGLLILDDLGTQSSTQWAEEKLYQIINHRYVKRLPTVITTNVRLNDMDGRIASRLCDPSLVTLVTMNVPDYRDPMSTSRKKNDISILHLMGEKTFDNFSLRRQDKLSSEAAGQLSNALTAATQFAEKPQGWLVFAGPSGIGKTHLAAAIGNEQKNRMEEAIFVSAPDLLDRLRACYSPNSTLNFDDIFDHLKNTPLLILNYLDTVSATSWAKEKIYQLLNYRYIAQLPTVITLTKAIKDVDPNIRSRLVDSNLCDIVQMFDVPMYCRNQEVELPPRNKKASKSE